MRLTARLRTASRVMPDSSETTVGTVALRPSIEPTVDITMQGLEQTLKTELRGAHERLCSGATPGQGRQQGQMWVKR